MRWPWGDRAQDPEHRQFDNAAVEALLLSAAGVSAEPAGTAAAVSGVGAIAGILTLARPDALADALTPGILRSYAEAMLLRGEWAAALEDDGTLLPASGIEVNGGASPASWYYDLRFPRASGGEVGRTLPGVGVVHVAWNQSAGSPWRGRSPLTNAGLTTQALANIEKSLRDDSSVPTGGIMPQPDGLSPKALAQVRTALTQGKGAMSIIETTAGGFGLGKESAPRKDWEQRRFGAEVPAGSIAFRDSASLSVLAALGVSPNLFTGDGSGMREAHRLMVAGPAQGLALLLSAEVARKTGISLTLNLGRAESVDPRGLGRAVASLVTSGMTLTEAVQLVGLDSNTTLAR